jgi:ComF family protein
MRLIAPDYCLGCGIEGFLLCSECAAYQAELVSKCYKCHTLTKDYRVCDHCRSGSSLLHVWSLANHQSLYKQVLYQIKYSYNQDACRDLAVALERSLPYLDPSVHILTYAPSASSRIRQRGFDHAKSIAEQLAKMRGLQCVSTLKRLDQSKQVGRTRQERFEQASKAYRVTSIDPSSQYIVIDDILTTGATLESIAKILRNAGARHVSAAVIIRK